MMKQHKWFSGLAAVLAAATILAGCGGKPAESGLSSAPSSDGGAPSVSSAPDNGPENFNPSGFPIVNEPVTVTMMGEKRPIQGDWSTLHFFTVMEEMTGIHFEFDTPPSSGFAEKKNLAFVGGTYADVLFSASLTAEEECKYGASGFFIPLEGLIGQYAPNLMKIFEENPEIKKAVTAPDGHIYSLPSITAGFGPYDKLWINGHMLEAAGKELPTTIDEFYEALKAFKAQDADCIPLTSNKLDDMFHLLSAFGMNDYPFFVENDVVRFAPTDDRNRAYLEFMNKLYTEQLLDNESFSQTAQQLNAKGADGRLGAFCLAGPFSAVGVEENENYPQVPAMTSAQSPAPITRVRSTITRGVFSITDKCKTPEAMIRWADYLYSEEGTRLGQLGIEGEDWKWVDQENKLTENIRPEGVNPEEYRGGTITPGCGGPVPMDLRKTDILVMTDDAALMNKIYELRKATNPQNAYIYKETCTRLYPYAQPGFPLVYFTEEELKRLTSLETDIKTYIEQMRANFVTGKEPLANWDSYVATMEQMGSEEYLSIYQAAYDRWKNS